MEASSSTDRLGVDPTGLCPFRRLRKGVARVSIQGPTRSARVVSIVTRMCLGSVRVRRHPRRRAGLGLLVQMQHRWAAVLAGSGKTVRGCWIRAAEQACEPDDNPSLHRRRGSDGHETDLVARTRGRGPAGFLHRRPRRHTPSPLFTAATTAGCATGRCPPGL